MEETYMMTIREAIKEYTESKAKVLGREISYVINNTSLCFIIPLNNGVRIFIDSHPEADYFKNDYPLEMANKNNVFKRISFEICDDTEPVIPKTMEKYITRSSANGVLYNVDAAKERVINEFISYNGGINEEKFIGNIKELWNYEISS